MNVGEFFAIIRKRWRIVGSITLAALAVTTVVLLVLPVKYAASVTLYVSSQTSSDNASAAYQGSLLSEQRVKSYSDLLVSNRIGQTVVEQLGLPESADDVTKEISVTAEPESILLTATVTDESQQRAIDIANSIGHGFPQLVAEIEQPLNKSQPAPVAVRVVQPAVPSDGPVSPRWTMSLALMLVAGLAVGLLVAYIRERTDNTIHSVKTAEDLTDSPALGVVAENEKLQNRITLEEDEYSQTLESYRRVRTNLTFLSIDRARRLIVITSSVPGEGKTSAVCNLGIVAAQAGYRTLLLDADLRRPMIARTFDLEGQVGLTSVLTGRIAHAAALQRTRFSNLDVLTSGPVPPNPSELLASENMRKLLEAVASEYDLVLVDTPPLIPVTDAAVASRYCDGTIMVCRHELVKRDQVTAGADSLRKAEAELLGLIYNGAKATEPLAASHYYTNSESRDGFGETSSRSPEHGGDARPSPHRRPSQTVR